MYTISLGFENANVENGGDFVGVAAKELLEKTILTPRFVWNLGAQNEPQLPDGIRTTWIPNPIESENGWRHNILFKTPKNQHYRRYYEILTRPVGLRTETVQIQGAVHTVHRYNITTRVCVF